MKKDFLKREINVDDYVICLMPYCRQLGLAKIVKITPKQLRVRFANRIDWRGNPEERVVYPEETVRVEGEDLSFYFLSK